MTQPVKPKKDSISIRLQLIRQRIQDTCRHCGRNVADIRLIGASKQQPMNRLISAIQEGLCTFGENYVQELLTKQEVMTQQYPQSIRQIEWHFIGRLQRRKVRQLIGHVEWIHSMDRIELAQEIERRAAERGLVQKTLIQVHLGPEASKGGIIPDELPQLVKSCADLAHIRVMGLMALPPYQENADATRPHFIQLRQLRDAINREAVYKEPLTELSMGMSHDYTVAVEEGATMVRIGTALFGERRSQESGVGNQKKQKPES